jgi:general secretion pathway protein D
LRAAPLQLAFDPTAFEVVAVEAGDYFSRQGSGQFSHSVDRAGGRISIGLTAPDRQPATGSGTLVRVQLRALDAAANTDVALIGFTPIGATQSLATPPLPLTYHVAVAP